MKQELCMKVQKNRCWDYVFQNHECVIDKLTISTSYLIPIFD